MRGLGSKPVARRKRHSVAMRPTSCSSQITGVAAGRRGDAREPGDADIRVSQLAGGAGVVARARGCRTGPGSRRSALPVLELPGASRRGTRRLEAAMAAAPTGTTTHVDGLLAIAGLAALQGENAAAQALCEDGLGRSRDWGTPLARPALCSCSGSRPSGVATSTLRHPDIGNPWLGANNGDLPTGSPARLPRSPMWSISRVM